MGIKYGVNEEFFDTWSCGMAYTLGYVFADGSLEDSPYIRGKYMRVTSVERSAISRIKNLMDSRHPIIVAKNTTWKNGRDRYCLRIGSHRIYDSLVNLGLFPNKSLTVKFPEVPDKFLPDFVRGYLDGDGCVYLERARGKQRKLIIKKLTVIFTSGSSEFLRGLNEALEKKTGTNRLRIYKSQRAYQLRYRTRDSITLFRFLYRNAPRNLYFKRKLKPFMIYFALRPIKVDKDIQSIIEYFGSGHVVKQLTRESAKLLFAGANPAVAS